MIETFFYYFFIPFTGSFLYSKFLCVYPKLAMKVLLYVLFILLILMSIFRAEGISQGPIFTPKFFLAMLGGFSGNQVGTNVFGYE